MNTPQNFFKQYLYIMSDKRNHLFLMVTLFVSSSVLELLGISLVGPFIGSVVNPTFLERFTAVNSFMHYFGILNSRDQIAILGSILLLVFLVKGAVAYGIYYYISSFTFYFRASLVQRLMNAYLRMPYQFYLERNSASVVNSVIAHTKTMTDDMLLPSLKLTSDAIVLFVIFVFLFWVDPYAMMILLLTLGAVSATYNIVVKPNVKSAGEEVAIQNEGLIKGVNQAIGGVKEIRVWGVQQYFLDYIKLTSTLCARSQKKFYSLIGLPRFLIETVFVVFVVLFALFTIYSEKNGEVMVATLAIFGVAGIRVLPALANVSSSLASMNYSRFALSELYSDLQDTENAQVEITTKLPNTHQVFKGLRIENIQFTYPSSDRPAIDNVSLTILQGESVGLIGISGSGKTTLIDILLGLHEFESGKFSINEIDIADYGWDNWLSQVAYIPQNVFLADDTLIKNIAFGVSDSEIDYIKLDEAISSAQLKHLVQRLPEGIHTIVGERGIRLSGGERQRVALARAFYHNRSVFIFDEATSALDIETERQVIDVIEKLHGKKTLIVIAHRLATVKSCDMIYKLKDGRVFDYGRFEHVVNTNNI